MAQPGITHPLPHCVSRKGEAGPGACWGWACASVGTPKIDAHTPFSEEAIPSGPYLHWPRAVSVLGSCTEITDFMADKGKLQDYKVTESHKSSVWVTHWQPAVKGSPTQADSFQRQECGATIQKGRMERELLGERGLQRPEGSVSHRWGVSGSDCGGRGSG